MDLTRPDSDLPHFSMEFVKEVFVWLIFHDEQFTPQNSGPTLLSALRVEVPVRPSDDHPGSVASFKCRQVCRRASSLRSLAANWKWLSMN